MIVMWFVTLATNVIDWIVSLVPTDPLPDWFTGLPDKLASVLTFTNDMGVWINLPLMASIATTCVGIVGLSFVTKGVLRLFSHVPEIGGAG